MENDVIPFEKKYITPQWKMMLDSIIGKLHDFLAQQHVICYQCWRLGKLRRQSTAYPNDADNFVFCCDDCFEERENFLKEQWDDYYASRL